MASRDFSFLSLRPPLVAYQANGLPVAPNTVFTTSNNGSVNFSNTVNISTVNVSTLDSNYISTNNIQANIVDVSTINANVINVDIISTFAHYTSSISTVSINSGYIQANNANINIISTNLISSNVIQTFYLSSFSTISLMSTNGTTALELTWNNKFLYIDGQPVATDGTVSTVSTVFWEDTSNTLSGHIVNKNKGISNNNYLVGIGYDLADPINATLDVVYTGSASGNVFNVSTINGQRLTMDSDGILNLTSSFQTGGNITINSPNYLSTNQIEGLLGLNINGRLNVGNGSEIAPGISFQIDDTTGLYGIVNGQMGISASGVQRILITDQNIDLTPNANQPVNISTVSNNNYTALNIVNSGNTSTSSKIVMTADDISYSLFTTGKNGAPDGSGLITSTFQLYSYYGPLSTIYPNGNMSVNGNLRLPNTNSLIANTLDMASGQITGLSSINGIKFNADQDTYWISTTAGSNNITNTNSGNVGIRSTLSTNYGIVNQNSGMRLIDGFGNASVRPALTPTNTLSSFVIHGANAIPANDDGFLQLSAGGGTNKDTISFIQLSGFSAVGDMNQNITLGTAGAERMRIISNGNIGIGTSNPINLLDVNGLVRIGNNQSGNNTSSFEINLGTSGVGNFRSAFIYSDGTNMEISNQQNGSLSLATNNSDKMIILPSGNVGIGTNTPQVTLDINGPAISRVATAQISSDPGNTYSAWAQYIGRYCFVTAGLTLTIPTSSPNPDDGSIIVFRNNAGTNITINGTIILDNKTASFIYTSQPGLGTPAWYVL
jgi:hypothetical protein